MRRLDTLYEELLRPDDRVYLKVDVQGGELDVLRGAERVLAQAPLVEAELSFVPLYEGAPRFDEVIDTSLDRGFGVHSIEPVFVRPAGRPAAAGRRDLRTARSLALTILRAVTRGLLHSLRHRTICRAAWCSTGRWNVPARLPAARVLHGHATEEGSTGSRLPALDDCPCGARGARSAAPAVKRTGRRSSTAGRRRLLSVSSLWTRNPESRRSRIWTPISCSSRTPKCYSRRWARTRR